MPNTQLIFTFNTFLFCAVSESSHHLCGFLASFDLLDSGLSQFDPVCDGLKVYTVLLHALRHSVKIKPSQTIAAEYRWTHSDQNVTNNQAILNLLLWIKTSNPVWASMFAWWITDFAWSTLIISISIQFLWQINSFCFTGISEWKILNTAFNSVHFVILSD